MLWPALLAVVLYSGMLPKTAAQHRSRGELLSKGGVVVATGRRLRGSSPLSAFDPLTASDTQLYAQHSGRLSTQHRVLYLDPWTDASVQHSRRSRALSQSGVPPPKRSLADKIAHAAEVRAMKPDLLLKNLKIREQNTTEYIPEACAERDELGTTTCAPVGCTPSCTDSMSHRWHYSRAVRTSHLIGTPINAHGSAVDALLAMQHASYDVQCCSPPN